MGRTCPCCPKEGLKRGAWTANEDKILTDYVKAHGEGKWRDIPKAAGLERCGKSCRLRWLNYLKLDIKRGNLTEDEKDLIIRLHRLLGNRWSLIAGRLPGRTDNEIKNYWRTKLSKKVQTAKNANLSKTERKPIIQQHSELEATSTGVVLGAPLMNANLVHFMPVESQSSDRSLSTLSKAENSSGSKGMVECQVGEISFSEILDSSFHELDDFGNIYNMDNVMEGVRKNSGQAFVVNEEMLDLGCLDYYFLESSEKWMI